MVGVVDWRAKQAALKALTNTEINHDMCRTIQPSCSESVSSNLRKWSDHTPRNPESRAFFDAMYTYLGCTTASSAALITCSYEEFLQLMSSTKRAMLMNQRRTSARSRFEVDLISHRGDLADEWVREGVVDQRFMYVSRDSVDTWNNVVTCGVYKTYDHCRSTLKQFLRQESWLKHVEAADISTLVILGAGAPEKDLMILNSLLSGKKYSSSAKLRMVIFDDSFFMLADTVDKIQQRLRFLKADDFVDVMPCCADFMNLRQWTDCTDRLGSERIAAYFILGGTIGNLPEERLVDAVRAVSEENDLFVVAGEFVEGEPSKEFLDHLLIGYDTPEARDLTLAPVRNLLDEERISQDIITRQKLVSVAIEPASVLPARLRTNMRGSFAVVFRLGRAIRGVKLILSISKRYRIDSFTKMMRSHRFDHLQTTTCFEWQYYHIMEFRRVETLGNSDSSVADEGQVL